MTDTGVPHQDDGHGERRSSRGFYSYPPPPSPDGGPAADNSATVLIPRIATDHSNRENGLDEHPRAEESAPAHREKTLLAATGSIAVATLISRITGFVKQIVMLAILGSAVASTFTAATLLPNMISELVLGAVLTAIVVPVLVRADLDDPDGGTAFVRRLFTVAFTVLFVVAVIATLSAPLLSRILIGDDARVSGPLTTALSYLVLPAILFYGLSGLLTAILNTRQNFRPGAWAPVYNNLVVLGIFSLYFFVPGEITVDPVRMSDPHILILGLGVTAGVITQVMALVPALRRERIDLRPLWGVDARLRAFGAMAAAIIIYVLISQAGLAFATRVSAHADDGGPAIYSQAWLLLQLPYGILGVTVLTAIMPRLARNAAQRNTYAVLDDLSVATRVTLVALVPIVVFLTLAGPWVGEALFGFGNFADDAPRLGEAVQWSAFTLIPYAVVLIHLRVFYARQQAWTPTWIILGITGVKIGLSALAPVVAQSDEQVVLWLGVANGIGFVIGAVIGGWLLHRSLGNLRMIDVGKTVLMVALASAAGGAAMLAIDRLGHVNALATMFGPAGPVLRVALGGVLMMSITVAILWYGRIPEVLVATAALTTILRRLRVTSTPPLDPATVTEPDTGPAAVLPGGSSTNNPGATRRADPRPDPHRSSYGGGVLRPPTPPWRQRQSTVAEHPAADVVGNAAAPTCFESRKFAMPADSVPVDAHPARADESRLPMTLPAGGAASGEPPKPHTGAPSGPRVAPLIPGVSVADGRYRLLTPHGGTHGLMFWHALDAKLDREVALTFFNNYQRAAEATPRPEGPQSILSRTLCLGRIDSPGLARVLDVVQSGPGVIIVAEWTPGRSLREMADTVVDPSSVANALRALTVAAEAAHSVGCALSIDHPDRVRISDSGDAVLAFPATLADADQGSDVRGLGAVLYALITARWPLSLVDDVSRMRSVGAMKPAQLDSEGVPIDAQAARPTMPFAISAIATDALTHNGEVRTAATMRHLLDRATAVE